MNLARAKCLSISLLFVGTLTNCISQKETSDVRSDDSFRNELGDLPEMPDKQQPAEKEKFVSLLNNQGSMSQGTANKPTYLAVGNNGKGNLVCYIPKGGRFAMIAKVAANTGKTYMIAQVQNPCKAKVKPYGAITDPAQGQDEVVPGGTEATPVPTVTPVATTTPGADGEDLIEGYVPAEDTDVNNNNEGENGGNGGENGNENENTGVDSSAEGGCEKVEQRVNATAATCGSPTATMNCSLPGDVFRKPAKSPQLSLLIHGTAKKWAINVTGSATKSADFTPVNSFPEVIVASTASLSTIPFKDFVPANSWKSVKDIAIKVQGLDDAGEHVGEVCEHHLRIMSPIVFEFRGKKSVATVHPAEKTAPQFDLDADGKSEITGWIYPSEGFLAYDRNNNGKIDNGSELFGEYSYSADKKSFSNGYEALAQYDHDKSAFIDAKDPIFSKLVVWFDKNSDARTQDGELSTLASLGITKIGTGSTNVAVSRHELPFGNRTLFQGKFFGPKSCGKGGCYSFDIFFGTISGAENLSGIAH